MLFLLRSWLFADDLAGLAERDPLANERLGGDPRPLGEVRPVSGVRLGLAQRLRRDLLLHQPAWARQPEPGDEGGRDRALAALPPLLDPRDDRGDERRVGGRTLRPAGAPRRAYGGRPLRKVVCERRDVALGETEVVE